MGITKTWNDIEEKVERERLPATEVKIIAHVVGVVLLDAVPDNSSFTNYKEGNVTDSVIIIYGVEDNETNFPSSMYTGADGKPRIPTNTTHVFKCGFPEKLSFGSKAKHLKTLKLLSQKPMTEELLRVRDLEDIYKDLIGCPVFVSLVDKKASKGDVIYTNLTDLTEAVGQTKKVFTENVELPDFLTQPLTIKDVPQGISAGFVSIADILEA
jgi:hypothetical protein